MSDTVGKRKQTVGTRPRIALAAQPNIKFHSEEELRAMSPDELVAEVVRIQQLYHQLDDDYRVISWEFSDYQDTLTLFSRTAKLAHRLDAANMETVIDVATEELPNYLNCRFAALYFYNAERKTIELVRSTFPIPGQKPLHLLNDVSHFLVKLFFHQSAPFVAEYVDEHTLCVGDEEEVIDSSITAEWVAALGSTCIVFPLQVKQNEETIILGGLILGDSTQPLAPSDAEAAQVFSDILSSSLHNARLLQQLNEMTIVDSLTQLYNRRHLLTQLNNAMLNAGRYDHPLAIAMLDIDHFKRVNDNHGHICGDMVLREIGDLLKATVRSGIDIPARYGGEEFVVIMPSINITQGVLAGNRIRSEVKKYPFLFREHRLSITCSVGVAEYIPGEAIEKFIDRADIALYEAKNSGRDRVIAHQSGRSTRVAISRLGAQE